MQVTRLSTTPIKGLALHHPEVIEVRATGVVGDRQFYFVDDRDTLFSIAKTGSLTGVRADFDEATGRLTLTEGEEVLASGQASPGAEHTAGFFGFKQVPGHLVPGPWDEVASERAGRRLRLVRARDLDGAHDVDPVTLLSDASTRRLSEQAGAPVDARRFRMLIEFDGAGAHAEDAWDGRRVQVGTTTLAVGGPVQRCAGTTRNPDTGEVDLRTLALIGDYRGRQDSIFGPGFNFGVYATVVAEGRVAVGDHLDLLD